MESGNVNNKYKQTSLGFMSDFQTLRANDNKQTDPKYVWELKLYSITLFPQTDGHPVTLEYLYLLVSRLKCVTGVSFQI